MGRLVAGYDLLFIDEAQRVPDIGINLKILTDGLPDLPIVATGSSSFELANRVSEPLTGRTWTHVLYPVSVLELARLHNPFELDFRRPAERTAIFDHRYVHEMPSFRRTNALPGGPEARQRSAPSERRSRAP